MNKTHEAIRYFVKAEQFHHQRNERAYLPQVEAARRVHDHFCKMARLTLPGKIDAIRQGIKHGSIIVPWTFDSWLDPFPPDDGSMFKDWSPAFGDFLIIWVLDYPDFDAWLAQYQSAQI